MLLNLTRPQTSLNSHITTNVVTPTNTHLQAVSNILSSVSLFIRIAITSIIAEMTTHIRTETGFTHPGMMSSVPFMSALHAKAYLNVAWTV